MEAAKKAGPNKMRTFCTANGMIFPVFFDAEALAQYPINSTVIMSVSCGQRVALLSLQNPPTAKAMQNQVLVLNIRHMISVVVIRKRRTNIAAAAVEGT